MKPAIFNTEMVRAILDGRKTQTRRMASDTAYLVYRCAKSTPSAPYQIGDIIYVRETFIRGVKHDENDYPLTTEDGSDWIWKTHYRADGKLLNWVDGDGYEINAPWKPSIHMPKEYARLFLRVKDIRIERLNEISYEDALAEGIARDFDEGNEWWLWKDYSTGKFEFEYDFRPEESFGTLWESIYGNSSFDNRYVWVIEFEQISKEEIGL